MPAATSIAIAALAVGVAGTVATGIAQKNQADFQEQVALQQAQRAKQVAAVNEVDFRKKISRQIGDIRAAKGELSGSELLSMEDFIAEAEVGALTIRNQGQVAATRLEQQASLFGSKGRSAVTSTGFRVGSQLLTGFSQFGKFGGGAPDADPTFNETDA